MSKRWLKHLNKLFTGYYHAGCTAIQVCSRKMFVLYLPLSRSAISTEGMTVHQTMSDQPHSLSQDMGTTFFILNIQLNHEESCFFYILI